MTMTLLIMALSGCGGNSETVVKLKDDYKLADISVKVTEKFKEKYGEDYMIGFPVDEIFLTDNCLLDMNDVEKYAGEYANNMVRNDAVVVVEAKKDSVAKISEAMEKYKQLLIERYQSYPVGGSFERAKSSEILIKGNYVIFICMGDFDKETGTPKFEDDMNLVKETVNGMFTE